MIFKIYLSVSSVQDPIIINCDNKFYRLDHYDNQTQFFIMEPSWALGCMTSYTYELDFESNDILEVAREIKLYIDSCYDKTSMPLKNINSSIEEWKRRKKLIILQ